LSACIDIFAFCELASVAKRLQKHANRTITVIFIIRNMCLISDMDCLYKK
jgi:hypothetical protein